MDNIRSELKVLFKKKYHEKIDMAYDALVQGNDDMELPMTSKQSFYVGKKQKSFLPRRLKLFDYSYNERRQIYIAKCFGGKR